MKGFIVTITGPSCGGKSTLEKYLAKRGFAHIISTTSRAPRAGDKNGVHYYFVSKEEFEAKIARDEMVESVRFDGNYYGGSKEEFERVFGTGKPACIVVEPEGCAQIRQVAAREGWTHLAVFINCPVELIAERFLKRAVQECFFLGTVDQVKLQSQIKRLGTMMGLEREWVRQAFEDYPYDITVDKFDESNENDVVELIVNLWHAHLRNATQVATTPRLAAA